MTEPRAQREPPFPDLEVGARRIRVFYLRHKLSAGIGVLALVATNLLQLWIPTLLGVAIDQVKAGEPSRLIAGTAGVIAAVALGAALARIGSRGFLFWAGRSAEHDMRVDLFAHLSALSPSFYRKQQIGDLVSRATNDLTNIRILLGFGVLTFVNFALVYGGNVPLLFLIDVPLALVALSSVPLLMLLTRYGARAIFSRSQKLQAIVGKLSSRITENLAGMSVVRSFGREDAELAALEELNSDYYRASVRLALVRGLLWPASGLIFGAATLAILGLGGLRVIDGTISLGQFVEFNTRMAALAWPTLAIGWVVGMWQRGRASMERINAVFATAPTIVDDPDAVEPELQGAIEARGLSVTYPGAGRAALDQVSFSLPAGAVLGVVGKTGSGKSTLAQALVRLVELDRDQLFIDGVDVTRMKAAALRRAVGYAEQDVFLFSDTLRENICFVRPDADEAEMCDVIGAVKLTQDIEALPDKLETLVGERGVTLSGGQRQRTALARALLARPRLLILDDSLSAVDAETEAAILEKLAEISRQQSTIIISHRLSAVRHADQILVLDAGRVVEQGHHDQLIGGAGLYAELWGEQAVEQELERVEGQP